MDRRRSVEQRLHDPPGLLDAVLARESGRIAGHGGVQKDLVGGRALTAHLCELDVEQDRRRRADVRPVGVAASGMGNWFKDIFAALKPTPDDVLRLRVVLSKEHFDAMYRSLPPDVKLMALPPKP